jgi:2-C-methyl-D-erythritol 4-phosphate cytidylyltransferase
MKKNCAIILAAGKGRRMGAEINKQFLQINNKPILYYTLDTFSKCESIDEIILVASKNEIKYCSEEVIKKYDIKKVCKVVAGGNERQNSVLNGLRAIENCEIVLIHDGARPFVNKEIIDKGIKYAETYGASACGVIPKDTIKIRNSQKFSDGTINRDSLFIVQTPQCFKYETILDFHEKIKEQDIKVTDDTMVIEQFGQSVYLYDGSYDNIKITTPEDIIIAEKILSLRVKNEI